MGGTHTGQKGSKAQKQRQGLRAHTRINTAWSPSISVLLEKPEARGLRYLTPYPRLLEGHTSSLLNTPFLLTPEQCQDRAKGGESAPVS